MERAGNQCDDALTEHEQACMNVALSLESAIEMITRYLTSGFATSPSQWRELFMALFQALFLREYISKYRANIMEIADNFLPNSMSGSLSYGFTSIHNY